LNQHVHKVQILILVFPIAAVSRAFQCLSDADLRANYDRYGHEDPNQLRQQQFQRRRAQGPSYDDFDPNDIFNAFFFGGNMNPNGGSCALLYS
jgi:DnaJ-class molecular chaperone